MLSCLDRQLKLECYGMPNVDPVLKTKLLRTWIQDMYRYAEEDRCLYRLQNLVVCNPHKDGKCHPTSLLEPHSTPTVWRQVQ